MVYKCNIVIILNLILLLSIFHTFVNHCAEKLERLHISERHAPNSSSSYTDSGAC